MKRLFLRMKNPQQMFACLNLRDLKTYFYYINTVRPVEMDNILAAAEAERIAHLKRTNA